MTGGLDNRCSVILVGKHAALIVQRARDGVDRQSWLQT